MGEVIPRVMQPSGGNAPCAVSPESLACGQGEKQHRRPFRAGTSWCTYWDLWDTSNLILEDPGSSRTHRHSEGSR